ncbi:MAG: hypothetical protein AAB685_02855 [Patescibacteria group bacterium]
MINLLPQEFLPDKGVVKLANILKTLSFILLTLLILSSLASIALLFYLNKQLADDQSQVERLKLNISVLSENEQKLFLIKDRLAKIKSLRKSQTEENLAKIDQLVSSLPQQFIYSGGEIDKLGAKITGTAGDSAALSEFLTGVEVSEDFKQVVIKNLNLAPGIGYSIGLDLF